MVSIIILIILSLTCYNCTNTTQTFLCSINNYKLDCSLDNINFNCSVNHNRDTILNGTLNGTCTYKQREIVTNSTIGCNCYKYNHTIYYAKCNCTLIFASNVEYINIRFADATQFTFVLILMVTCPTVVILFVIIIKVYARCNGRSIRCKDFKYNELL